MSFTIFQNKKMPFQAIKTRSLKSRKRDIFLKGLAHGFGPKMATFPTFVFRQYRPGKCLLRYSRRKKVAFQAIKTRSSKRRKVDIFLKGLTYGFGPKWPFFQFFFGGNIDQENIFYDILEGKMPFQALKTRRSKSRKIHSF